MDLMKTVKKLCLPSYIYLVISAISMVVLVFQNYTNTNTFCVGDFECDVPNTLSVLIIEGVYILFWTFILDVLCKAGYERMSWFLVLLPFLLFFIVIGLLMLNQTM